MLALVFFAGGCLKPSTLPVASFMRTPAAGSSPLVVTFDASGSHAPAGIIVKYEWSFGDGAEGTGLSAAHTYTTEVEHRFTVTLTVIDNGGQRASASQSVLVQATIAPAVEEAVEFVWPFHHDAVGDDAANLNDEYFTLQNKGSGAVDLTGWSVENERGLAFRFPHGFTLGAGAVVTIHSGAGANTADILHWDAAAPVWVTNDIAVLRNADGRIVDFYTLQAC